MFLVVIKRIFFLRPRGLSHIISLSLKIVATCSVMISGLQFNGSPFIDVEAKSSSRWYSISIGNFGFLLT